MQRHGGYLKPHGEAGDRGTKGHTVLPPRSTSWGCSRTGQGRDMVQGLTVRPSTALGQDIRPLGMNQVLALLSTPFPANTDWNNVLS